MWLTGLGGLVAVTWLYLLLLKGRFWLCGEQLGAGRGAHSPADWPSVVAVVPARDEAAVIGATITAHQQSNYRGPFAIVIVDDHSTDGTAGIARHAADAAGHRRPLHVIDAPALPQGWTGKLSAMQAGLDHAHAIAPAAEYILFTDADIIHDPDVLSRLTAFAAAEDKALVSLMARLDDRGFWAGLLIPAFVFFFQMLYPFPRVNTRSRRSAAAAGGCMLVRRDALTAVGELAPIKDCLIDDCALARLIKGDPPQRDIWLGLTTEVRSRRDNRQLCAIWNMVARTAFTQLRYGPLLLTGTLVGLVLTYVVPLLLLATWPVHASPIAGVLGAAAFIAMIIAYSPTLRLYGRPPWQVAGLPLAALLYGAMTFDSACRHWRGAGGRWKGRRYRPNVHVQQTKR